MTHIRKEKSPLNAEQKSALSAKIKTYCATELDCDIGAFEAEFLMDFIAEQIAPHYYNQGLSDAQLLMSQSSEELSYRIQELEKPAVT